MSPSTGTSYRHIHKLINIYNTFCLLQYYNSNNIFYILKFSICSILTIPFLLAYYK